MNDLQQALVDAGLAIAPPPRPKKKLSRTEKGAIQYSFSGKECVELFSQIGAMRVYSLHDDGYEMVGLDFIRAFKEDPQTALKILFWARWARGGAGEKATFHIIFNYLCQEQPIFIKDNLKAVVEYGYWKDLIPYTDFEVYPIIGKEIEQLWAIALLKKDRLACKWAPRKGKLALSLKERMNFTWKDYRVWLKKHSSTVEQNMCSKDFDKIEYSKVPSIAMTKYNKAFRKRDETRFETFLNNKEAKANASVLYPHQVFQKLKSDEGLGEKLWENLPDYVTEGESILPVVDVSGSMMHCGLKPEPIEVSVSLGLYLAERNKGKFKNQMITFSEQPGWISVKDDWTLKQKFEFISQADWGFTTNFESAYRLILDTATAYNVPKENMPTMLLVLSDMQFDEANDRNRPHMKLIKERFRNAGYKVPKLVFWNLRSANNGVPSTAQEEGVSMVSGFSPAIMTAILKAENFTPHSVMMEALKPIKLDFKGLVT